ncbi:SDR family NAD(P)-dependent oxidoreductase [Paenibacillus planticolens]|uniref:SDR family NAD(P)-dependent oxidoreductase n=1 Tax=Paenibacillus planticolens TaxID=2654976 RepID=A0ABX1ZIK4_9BACL|nr:SDR family NAD(P)-dependent oxidoreductase [Paenibacillus planticolens]NOU98802.1 SDR family NAD(P)-dependent oxidoreductase [Paenibacillus planticolens]
MGNKVWLVTGSSRGLGREIVSRALEQGDCVIATARNLASLEELSGKHGDRVFTLKLDVTDVEEVQAVVQEGLRNFGRIDVLVNNAGYANVASIEDMDILDFQKQVNANFFGVVYMTKAVLPIMREQKRGSMINISSIGGRFGSAGLGAYQSSKFAVNGFTEVLAKEVASFGIKVTTVEPGGIATDWAGSSMNIPEISDPYLPVIGPVVAHLQNMTASTPEKRIGIVSDPAKIAEAIYELTEMAEPPLHLLMGTSAWRIAQEGAKRLAESDLKYEELTKSTVYME